LADTIGVGTRVKVPRALEATLQNYGIDEISGQCHDTYRQALSNALASLDMGVWQLDTSSSGLGGCPCAKGANGNAVAEDVVYILHGVGIETGIDLNTLIDAGSASGRRRRASRTRGCPRRLERRPDRR